MQTLRHLMFMYSELLMDHGPLTMWIYFQPRSVMKRPAQRL